MAVDLSKSRRVTILDQTGEYVGKKGFSAYEKSVDMKAPGVTVFERKIGEIAANRALSFLEYLVEIALEEYKAGTPFPRVVIIDEAHQLIPEPAGLGFNAPGRDSSFKIGALLMQIRKYGISVFLISQRTAVVAKSALSQCENLIAFRSVDQTGLDYLEAVAGGEIRSLLPQLRQGEALVFGPAISADGAVAIEVSKTELRTGAVHASG
jgi:DNA helicase HerA-like ATPase